MIAADVTEPGVPTSIITSVRPEFVVHLAGGPRATFHESLMLNFLPSTEILEATRGSECKTVLIGSAAEYGDHGANPIGEGAALTPLSEYGKAKAAQSLYAARIASERVMVLRPFNVYAPSLMPQSTALGDLQAQLLAQRHEGSLTWQWGNPFLVRDYVSVDFVVAVILACLTNWRPACSPLNVCSGVPITMADVVSAIGALSGKPVAYQTALLGSPMPTPRYVLGDPTKLSTVTGLRHVTSSTDVAEALLTPLRPGSLGATVR